MFHLIMVGLWVCVVSFASVYGGATWNARQARLSVDASESAKSEVKKVKPITVPVISGGALKGYISAEFSFVMSVDHRPVAGLDPENFIMDEAFRLIYSDNSLDFSHLEKVDIDRLTKQVTQNVNARLGAPRVKETLVKNLSFVAKEDIPR